MEDKERFLIAELVLTFSLLFYVTNLLQDVISFYRYYLILGFIAGFVFSWFKKIKPNIINYIITFSAITTFIWIVYSIFNSSFFYKDVIIIWIKGLLVLQLMLSFNASRSPILSYIQALSIPLFMSSAVFIKYYDREIAILILSYFIIWFVILKIQFYKSLKPGSKTYYRHYYSMAIAIPVFLIILSLSWMMFHRFLLGEIKKGGIFTEEGIGPERGMESQEKEYYALQDEFQKKVTELILKLNDQEGRLGALALLSSMIKESPYAMEVDKAQNGLIDYLHRPGLGLEEKDTEELTILMDKFLERKIMLNAKRNKDDLVLKLKKDSLSMKDRFSATSLANKLHYSNSYENIKKYERELNKTIDNSLLNSDAKREAEGLAGKLKEWKGFESYTRKMSDLYKKIDSMQGQERQGFQDLLSSIKKAEGLNDFKEIEQKMDGRKKKVLPQSEGLMKEIEEILDLKLDMVVAKNAGDLKEKIENSNLTQYDLNDLREYSDNIKDADNYREFQESFLKLQEKAKDDNLMINKELKNIREMEIYSFTKAKKDKIKELLKENTPANVKQEFLENLEKLDEQNRIEKLSSQMEKMKQEIEDFVSKGFISKTSKDSLEKDVEAIQEIVSSQRINKENKTAYLLVQEQQLNYQEQLEELIESSSLNAEKKQLLKELSKGILNAESLLQLQNMQEAIQEELDSLSKEDQYKQEIKEIKQKLTELAEVKQSFIVDKAYFPVIKKLEESGKETNNLEDYLEKIRKSKTAEQLKANIKKFEEYALSSSKEKNEKDRIYSCKIDIIPSRLIIPKGSSLSLKTFAIYNNSFVKELKSGLEWFSPEPNIAWVDGLGVLHSVSGGKIKITATYKGIMSRDIEVSVVDKLSEEIDATIKNEIGR